MLVDYYYIENEKPERCDVEYIEKSNKIKECYHLGCRIERGEPFYRLQRFKNNSNFDLCEVCYHSACFRVEFQEYLNGKTMTSETYNAIINHLLDLCIPPKIETTDQGLIISNLNNRDFFPFANGAAELQRILKDNKISNDALTEIVNFLFRGQTEYIVSVNDSKLIIENREKECFIIVPLDDDN